MVDPVKSRRPYNSTRRRQQANQTRRDIVAAAGRLVHDRGYQVSMAAIAAEAGVAVETIYRIFGSKPGLIRAVVEALLAGGVERSERPVEERPAIRAVIEEPDARRRIVRWAATQPGIHRRAGPLLRAVRAGAASDPELARLWAELEAWRLEGQGRLVERLAADGALRSDRTVAQSSDIVLTLSSLAVHDLLVLERGWTEADYGAWLAESLVRELVGSG
jgi:AcrR family transcriptional regulator